MILIFEIAAGILLALIAIPIIGLVICAIGEALQTIFAPIFQLLFWLMDLVQKANAKFESAIDSENPTPPTKEPR